eukprot:m51a1_g2717 hypothetical protein (826) ;mRNA; r:844116-847974
MQALQAPLVVQSTAYDEDEEIASSSPLSSGTPSPSASPALQPRPAGPCDADGRPTDEGLGEAELLEVGSALGQLEGGELEAVLRDALAATSSDSEGVDQVLAQMAGIMLVAANRPEDLAEDHLAAVLAAAPRILAHILPRDPRLLQDSSRVVRAAVCFIQAILKAAAAFGVLEDREDLVKCLEIIFGLLGYKALLVADAARHFGFEHVREPVQAMALYLDSVGGSQAIARRLAEGKPSLPLRALQAYLVFFIQVWNIAEVTELANYVRVLLNDVNANGSAGTTAMTLTSDWSLQKINTPDFQKRCTGVMMLAVRLWHLPGFYVTFVQELATRVQKRFTSCLAGDHLPSTPPTWINGSTEWLDTASFDAFVRGNRILETIFDPSFEDRDLSDFLSTSRPILKCIAVGGNTRKGDFDLLFALLEGLVEYVVSEIWYAISDLAHRNCRSKEVVMYLLERCSTATPSQVMIGCLAELCHPGQDREVTCAIIEYLFSVAVACPKMQAKIEIALESVSSQCLLAVDYDFFVDKLKEGILGATLSSYLVERKGIVPTLIGMTKDAMKTDSTVFMDDELNIQHPPEGVELGLIFAMFLARVHGAGTFSDTDLATVWSLVISDHRFSRWGHHWLRKLTDKGLRPLGMENTVRAVAWLTDPLLTSLDSEALLTLKQFVVLIAVEQQNAMLESTTMTYSAENLQFSLVTWPFPYTAYFLCDIYSKIPLEYQESACEQVVGDILQFVESLLMDPKSNRSTIDRYLMSMRIFCQRTGVGVQQSDTSSLVATLKEFIPNMPDKVYQYALEHCKNRVEDACALIIEMDPEFVQLVREHDA